MEARILKIRPDDAARLRELLKSLEQEIDAYTDEQLDAAEQKLSQRVSWLVQEPARSKNVLPMRKHRKPFLASAAAGLVAAAAILSVHVRVQDNGPTEPQFVSKGTVAAPSLDCELKVVTSDGGTPDSDGLSYLVDAAQSSYLKVYCGQDVFVHIGSIKGETMQLELRNLSVAAGNKIVMQGQSPLDITALVKGRQGTLNVLLTKVPLSGAEFSLKDRRDVRWEELPLRLHSAQ